MTSRSKADMIAATGLIVHLLFAAFSVWMGFGLSAVINGVAAGIWWGRLHPERETLAVRLAAEREVLSLTERNTHRESVFRSLAAELEALIASPDLACCGRTVDTDSGPACCGSPVEVVTVEATDLQSIADRLKGV